MLLKSTGPYFLIRTFSARDTSSSEFAIMPIKSFARDGSAGDDIVIVSLRK